MSNDVSTRTPSLMNEEAIFQVAADMPAAERAAYLLTLVRVNRPCARASSDCSLA